VTRTRRFLGGLLFGYGNQLLITVVGLWLTAFLLNRLGETDYGLWLVAAQILAYLLLMDLGVVALIPRETAFATGRAGGQKAAADELPAIIGRATRIVLWQLPFVAAVTLIVWVAIPGDWAPLKRPLALVMMAFVVLFPCRIMQGVLEGLQDLAFLGSVHTISWAVSTSTTVLLVLSGIGLHALAVGWTVGQITSAVLWWIRLRRRYASALPLRLPHFSLGDVRQRLTQSLWVSAGQVAQVLLTSTHLVIIGKVVGPVAVVSFFCTEKLIAVLSNQPRLFIQTAGPALSELRAGSSNEHLFRVCTALCQAMLLASGGIVCMVLPVNERFVGWWVGADEYAGFTLTVLLLSGMLLRHWNATTVYTIFAFGRDRRIAVTRILDGLLTVATSIGLVAWIGPVGAAIGPIIGVCVVSLPANLSALARELDISILKAMQPLWPWFWRFAIAASAALMVTGLGTPPTLLLSLLWAIAVVAVYLLLMMPVVWRGPLAPYIRPRITSLRHRLRRTS
jgi:O-antigen/teichoic acid export membrane protein